MEAMFHRMIGNAPDPQLVRIFGQKRAETTELAISNVGIAQKNSISLQINSGR